MNSGSEANDLALLMARVYTGNFEAIALQNAYHGTSAATMGLTGHSTWKQVAPIYNGIHHVRQKCFVYCILLSGFSFLKKMYSMSIRPYVCLSASYNNAIFHLKFSMLKEHKFDRVVIVLNSKFTTSIKKKFKQL